MIFLYLGFVADSSFICVSDLCEVAAIGAPVRMACFFGIPFEAISSFTNCALISVSYLVVLGTFCTCVSTLCAPSGIFRPIARESVLDWTMIDACLQIRLDIMQELRRSQTTSIRRQALCTEGPIRLFARLTWIHTLNLWI